jgi:hypothetical protein
MNVNNFPKVLSCPKMVALWVKVRQNIKSSWETNLQEVGPFQMTYRTCLDKKLPQKQKRDANTYHAGCPKEL